MPAMRSAGRIFTLAFLLSGASTACARLPEQVPWETTFTVESGRLPDVAGAELLVDGKPVTKVTANPTSAVIALARGTTPKGSSRTARRSGGSTARRARTS